MAVGLPGEAKLEASIFFTVFKVKLIHASQCNLMLIYRYRVSISKDPMLGLCLSSPYPRITLIIHVDFCSNRQDAQEALNIAARGKVKCHFVVKKLSDLKE
jgi:propanol-preferring alcohol dehydrogenase